MLFDINHLKKAHTKNYFTHGFRVIIVSIQLIFLGLVGLVHAILPFVFVETVGDGVRKLKNEMDDF